VTTPILFDTDIGTDVDDAIALAFLALDPRCDLLGVTTVNGDTRRRAALARALLDLAGVTDVPIGVGASDPITPGGSRLMPVGVIADGPVAPVAHDAPTAEDVIVDALRAASEPVHVCGVGAFTNLATVLSAHPELHDRVATLHLMGGCLGANPSAEFNLNGDPTAAAVCLALPLPLRLAPYDVTNHLSFTSEDRAAIASAGDLGAALGAQMTQWLDFLATVSDDPTFPQVRLHDPLTVVGVVAPDMEKAAELPLAVAGSPGHAYFEESPSGRPVTVVRAADSERLRGELTSAICGPRAV
jgi:inosine-uridine nucleoside N-ribohydrolase